MIRSIITVAALGFALAGCTPATTTEAPAPAPAPVVAPAVEPAPAVEQPTVEQAPAVEPQQSPALTCEPNANARFDPQNPHVIVNKACGYTDAQGQERSRNPWIDDQLDQARQNAQNMHDGEQWLRQQDQQVQQMVDDARQQQQRNLEQVNEQIDQQFPGMPQVPTVVPGDAGYEQQMDSYRQQVNEYMAN